MLLDPSGRLARRTLVPLTAEVIRCLVVGRHFLRHGADVLRAARLEPFCRLCVARGGSGAIVFTPQADRVVFQCGHIRGHVLTTQETEVEPLLHALDWGIRCADCHTDAVGDNHKGSATFKVECHCTTREMPNPVASVASE